jgi:high-affinity K+ transport system ATPase subunit B
LSGDRGFTLLIAIWLWFTVLFANFAEAMAEGRKAQADTLRKTRTHAQAKRLQANGQVRTVSATELRRGDLVLVEAGDLIPSDGEVIEGVAYAQAHKVIQMVIGQSSRGRWEEIFHGSVTHDLPRKAQGIDVLVVAEPKQARPREREDHTPA